MENCANASDFVPSTISKHKTQKTRNSPNQYTVSGGAVENIKTRKHQ
jgi:hypothetical protein